MRKKLSTYIWEYKWAYLFAIVSLIISVSLDMLAPMLTMHIIDDVILGGELAILPYFSICKRIHLRSHRFLGCLRYAQKPVRSYSEFKLQFL